MIGEVFLLSRDPARVADWYHRHLGWEFQRMANEETWYAEVYFREDERPEVRQNLVCAIMPGDPGEAGRGHIVNCRVDDIEAVVASLRDDGCDVSAIEIGEDAEGQGRFARLDDPEGRRIELWEHLQPG